MREKTTRSESPCPRRRKLLAALGLGGAVAYVAPTLFSLGQAEAGSFDEGHWRIIYDTDPGGRRYVDDYREHRRHRDRHHRHRNRHHHKHRHSKHSRHSHSRPSFSRPSHSRPSRW